MLDNILFVDDEERSLSAFRNLFRRKYKVFTAGSGEEGLELLAAHPIHVVITDQRMPEMSGIDFLRKVKSKWPDTKLIILTAYNDAEVLKEAINEVGVFWFMNKPFEPEQMDQIITNAESTYQAEMAFKESEEKFRGIFNSMEDVFSRSDLEGKCVLITPSIFPLLGYQPQEMIGRQLADFYVHPEQRLEIIQKLEKGEKVENFEIEIFRKDEAIITISTNAKIYYDNGGKPLGVEGIFRDITAQKKAESEHDKLFNVSFDLLCIAGMDGYFKELNPAWEKATGYSTKELTEKPFADFIHPDDVARTLEEVNRLSEGGAAAIDFENRYITRDGSVLHFSWTATSIPEEEMMYCIARDISQRKEAERRVYEYQQRLKDLANEVTLAEERVRQQIAVDLHDQVSQMLSSARMQLSSINEMLENPEASIRINHVSKSLLKSIQATREAIFNLRIPQLDEIGLYAAVHDWMKEEVESKHGIETSLVGDDERYHFDQNTRVLIFRSIKELMMNVVKHARAQKLDVSFRRTDGILEIMVQDDGIGFQYNPELLKLKGQHYGLFSIQERISDMGGSVDIDSQLEIGTNIKLNIPLK